MTDPARPHLIRRWLLPEMTRVESGSAEVAELSPDRALVGLVGRDRVLVLLDNGRADAVVRDPVAAACARAGRGLTRDEWSLAVPTEEFRETCPGKS